MTWTLLPIARFAEASAEWDALCRATGMPPFLESGFLRPLIEVFAGGSEQLALLRAGSSWLAAAILRPRGWGLWETFQPSQLPLGPVLAPPGQDLAELANGLLRALPGVGLSLGLTQLDPRSVARPAQGPATRSSDYIHTAWVDIAGSFDAFWDARGKNLRQNVRKQRNKLQADGVAVELRCTRDAGGVAQALVHYGAMESAGWKAEGGTAIHPDNDQGRFYRAMLENFCADGRGRIYSLCLDGTPVAMDLCIEAAGELVILKTTYDEQQKALSPSTLMRHEQFRQLFDEGSIRRIEFFGPIMEWHTRWTDNARTLYHANVDRWAAVEWMRALKARLRPPGAAGQPASHGTHG